MEQEAKCRGRKKFIRMLTDGVLGESDTMARSKFRIIVNAIRGGCTDGVLVDAFRELASHGYVWSLYYGELAGNLRKIYIEAFLGPCTHCNGESTKAREVRLKIAESEGWIKLDLDGDILPEVGFDRDGSGVAPSLHFDSDPGTSYDFRSAYPKELVSKENVSKWKSVATGPRVPLNLETGSGIRALCLGCRHGYNHCTICDFETGSGIRALRLGCRHGYDHCTICDFERRYNGG